MIFWGKIFVKNHLIITEGIFFQVMYSEVIYGPPNNKTYAF